MLTVLFLSVFKCELYRFFSFNLSILHLANGEKERERANAWLVAK